MGNGPSRVPAAGGQDRPGEHMGGTHVQGLQGGMPWWCWLLLACLALPWPPQALHRLEVFITRGSEGKTSKVFVAEMTEEKSIELAQKVASEGFVFVVRCTVCSPASHLHGRCT